MENKKSQRIEGGSSLMFLTLALSCRLKISLPGHHSSVDFTPNKTIYPINVCL